MVQTRVRATLGTIVFFFLAPGSTAGLVPWLITRWEGDVPAWAQLTGATVVVAGTLLVVAAFAQFALEGRGTPAPTAPTQELVVGGLYRWVRNPMYLGVSTAIAGQAVLFGSVGVGIWLAVFVLATTTFTLAYEEPTLRRTYGASYDAYAAAVPRWRPRLTPRRP
ncbi:methyltransferase family protein [Nocardioides bizhenqiangii]|uniref:Isoprenylcysteine carboxylmethyltransferase family protein n=1 Tax=Nocardioides bizhenqiangii TaxID=3095076 RepID=A0ABZ0ZLI7_9ACTN|nr:MULTISPECIES: isoprenylcysteine carboxylmethyltransferase family protein [unclassified Nocardioides]MDZ5620448.1 isoprenylcysteine carboxylmethyltransferase family protein [Nocardioides sp. HM23]WQQ24816.1 isoprenylcysteine carboxylmethyltransferase family protein [Nocardioides sp. HM61]